MSVYFSYFWSFFLVLLVSLFFSSPSLQWAPGEGRAEGRLEAQAELSYWAVILAKYPCLFFSIWRGFFCLEGSEWVYRGQQETKDVCMCVSLSESFRQSFVTTEEIFRGDVSGINKTEQLSYGSM